MIFAETDRLYIRALGKNELPRMVKLLDVWDVVRWLTVVPFPYTMRDGEDFYGDVAASYGHGMPLAYVLAQKTDNLLIGLLGLHPPRTADAAIGEIEIGYWLGKDYWGRGFMSEAAREGVKIGFARPDTRMISATTQMNNLGSQTVLKKIGLRNQGIVPRTYKSFRGDDHVIKWLLTREEYEKGSSA